jgi:hypothetical protein
MMTDATQFGKLPNESAGETNPAAILHRQRREMVATISVWRSLCEKAPLGSSARARLREYFAGEMSIHAGLS